MELAEKKSRWKSEQVFLVKYRRDESSHPHPLITVDVTIRYPIDGIFDGQNDGNMLGAVYFSLFIETHNTIRCSSKY
jgi:hypothetical protein